MKAISYNWQGISQHCHSFSFGLYMGFLFQCSLATLLTSRGRSWMEVIWPQQKSYGHFTNLMQKAHAGVKERRC